MKVNFRLMKPMTFGQRIRELREARGWSQEKLAKRSHVTRGSISQWETGVTKDVDAAKLVACAKALGVTLEYLLSGEHSDVAEAPGAYGCDDMPTELASAWHLLTPTQREQITAEAQRLAAHNAELLRQLSEQSSD